MGVAMSVRSHLRDPIYLNGVALVANAGVSAVLGFVFWMVAARRFHPDALGVGAAVVSASTLAALIGKAGFDAVVIRYAPSADPRNVRRVLLRATLATVGLTTLVALVLLALAVAGVSGLDGLARPAFAAGFVLLAIGSATGWILDAFFIAEQRAEGVLLRNFALGLVKILVPLFLAWEFAGRAVPLAWGAGIAASLIVALALLPRLLARHRPTGIPPSRAAFGYAMRNYALNLSEFLPGLVLPVIVLHFLGAEENARFFLAWTLATVAFLASKAIAQSSFAALVRDGEGRGALKKGLLLSALVLAPAAIVLHLGAPLLLGLFGEHYASASGLLRLLALSLPPIVAFNLYLSYLKARDEGKELTLLPLLSLATLLVVLPISLRWGGIEGVGIAWLAVQSTFGAYAAIRLLSRFGRFPHALRPRLRRHPHQG